MFILALAPSAHAGQWLFTYSGNPTVTQNPARSPFAWSPPVTPVSSVSVSYQAGTFPDSSGASTTSETVKCPIQVTIAWSPSGTLASDPQPAFIRLAESGAATWSASGYYSTPTQTSVSGTGAATIANVPASTVQYSTVPTLSRPVTESANLTLSPPPNTSAGGNVGNTFSYSVQAVSISPSLVVDQDQQIFAPAATTRFSATISNASGFTIDSVKISVDGTPTAATANPSNPNNYFIDWPQSGGNPSEHTVTATAQIHDSVGALSLNSTDLPNRQYATCGMGRPADDIIADVKPLSIKFSGNIPLNQDAVTPVPSPEFTWTAASGVSPATSSPVAYVQGQKPGFTLILASSAGAALTGSAPLGYGLKLQANPNTTNPATSQADPTLTLYDNTTASPFMPTACSASIPISATTALDSWVAPYSLSFTALNVYVEFTKVPTPVWRSLGSYASTPFGTPLYAVVATPTAPMAKPWARVLGLACSWAARDATAATATHDLVTNEYLHCTYNGGYIADTAPPDDGTSPDSKEIFYLADFLSGTTRPNAASLQGQCDDFSDFLSCISNAVGALPLQPQRSQTLAAINNSTDPTSITTVLLLGANAVPPAATYQKIWSYHQFTNSSASIFDGSVRLGGTTTVENLMGPALGSNYYDVFIVSTRHSDPSKDWKPVNPLSVDVRNNKP